MKSSTSPSKLISLGHRLHVLNSLNRTQPASVGDDGLSNRMKLQAVERFFEDVKVFIEHELDASRVPAPIELRRYWRGPISTAAAAAALDLYSWSRNETQVPQKSPMRGVWNAFVAWAESEDLEAFFKDDHDGMGQESWKTLHIQPNRSVFAKPLELAEGSVVVPKEMLAKYGSVQAYVDHLASLAKTA